MFLQLYTCAAMTAPCQTMPQLTSVCAMLPGLSLTADHRKTVISLHSALIQKWLWASKEWVNQSRFAFVLKLRRVSLCTGNSTVTSGWSSARTWRTASPIRCEHCWPLRVFHTPATSSFTLKDCFFSLHWFNIWNIYSLSDFSFVLFKKKKSRVFSFLYCCFSYH